MSRSIYKFIFLPILIVIFSLGSETEVCAQLNGYTIEEERFGLTSNEFTYVSKNINGNIYILDSDRKKIWVHNIEDNTTTNIVTSDSTLFVSNIIYFKGATFINMSCETGGAVIQTQNTFSSTKKILQVSDVLSDGNGVEFIVYNEQLYMSQNSKNKIFRLDNPMSEVQLFVDMKDFGEMELPWHIRRGFFEMDSRLFFTALQDNYEVMWSTNGSDSDLELLKKENGEIIQDFRDPLFFNNTIYFSLDDDIKETWAYDSSSKKAVLFDDFELITNFQVPAHLNNGLVLSLDGSQHGVEPWFFDGTKEGTHILKDIDPNGNSNPSKFATYIDVVMFNAELGERWESDGTSNGTKHVGSLTFSTIIQDMDNRQFELRPIGSDKVVLYEYMGDGVLNEIKEVEGALGSVGIGRPYFSVIFEEFFFFYTRNNTNGTYKNWFSDGTTDNTHMLDDSLNLHGYISKKMEIDERILISFRSNNKSLYFNVKKEDATIEMATVIDNSELINLDLCSQTVSTGTENIVVENNEIKLFPNPTSKYVEISSESGDRINIKILDSQGRTVLSDQSFKEVHNVSLENVSAGIYFVHIMQENSDATYVKKIIKH